MRIGFVVVLVALVACSSSDDKKTSSSSSTSSGGGSSSSSGSSGGGECTKTDQCPLLSCTCGGAGSQIQQCNGGVCVKNCGEVAGCQ